MPVYSALFLTEGVGLVFRKRWGTSLDLTGGRGDEGTARGVSAVEAEARGSPLRHEAGTGTHVSGQLATFG